MGQAEKDLLLSSNFWGLLAMVAGMYCQSKGIHFDSTEFINMGVMFSGALMNIYGRTSATQPIGSVLGVKLPPFMKSN